MNARCLFVCTALVLLANAAFASGGSYQRTTDRKTLVWNNHPRPDDEVTWSGSQDADGYATGYGTLTWYRVERANVMGSNIPSAKHTATSRYSGNMVRGKLEGPVVNVDADGKTFHGTYSGGSKTSDWAAGPAPAIPDQPDIVAKTPRSTADQRLKESVPDEAVTEAPITKPTPKPDQRPRERPSGDAVAATATPKLTPAVDQRVVEGKPTAGPAQPNDSIRSLAAPPSELRTGPETEVSPQPSIWGTPSAPSLEPAASPDDAKTVASLDTRYQAAVKANDDATMEQILADDFVLVTGRGRVSTKADLLKEAREKQTIYEHQEEKEGTQEVRIWGDTAVVTALLWIKGAAGEKPLDYQLWFSDTYVRTPAGWRYIFGQASIPLPKTDAK